jgi:hypothetical protein
LAFSWESAEHATDPVIPTATKNQADTPRAAPTHTR